jgi:hypothetical protein
MSGAFGPTASSARMRILPRWWSTPQPSASLDRQMVACSRCMEPSGSVRSGGWQPTNCSCWGGPDDAAIRRLFTTMQKMIRGGRMGETIVFSIRESVNREVRRGHLERWGGAAVQAFRSRVGVGLIDLFLRCKRPRSANVAWRELVASLPAELDPVQDTEGTLEQYRQLHAEVLLMYGGPTSRCGCVCLDAPEPPPICQFGRTLLTHPSS